MIKELENSKCLAIRALTNGIILLISYWLHGKLNLKIIISL